MHAYILDIFRLLDERLMDEYSRYRLRHVRKYYLASQRSYRSLTY